MTVLSAARRRRRGTYHVKWPTPKHVENSVRGVRHAIRYWFARIDLDLCITKADPACTHHPAGEPCQGHVVACHWERPMMKDGFRDPLKRIPRTRMVRDMTLDEVMRLVAPGGYHILPIEHLLMACGNHIIALLEPKGDPRFNEDWPWVHIRDVANRNNVHLEAYALPANKAALPVAHRVLNCKVSVIKHGR